MSDIPTNHGLAPDRAGLDGISPRLQHRPIRIDTGLTSSRSPVSTLRRRHHSHTRAHAKRIVMNPPQSFVMAAAAAQPFNPVNQPIMFDAGQAVMGAPTTGVASDAASAIDGPSPTTGQATTSAAASVPVATMSASGESQTAQATATQTQPTPTDAATTQGSTQTQIIIVSQSVMQIVTTQAETPTPTSAVASGLMISTTGRTSGTSASGHASATSVKATDSVVTLTASESLSQSSSSRSASVSASSTATLSAPSSSASAEVDRPFTQTAPFIFLIVLGSLVVVALTATACSTLLRARTGRSCFGVPCFPCCRKDIDEDEGFEDLVGDYDLDPFRTISRASSRRSQQELENDVSPSGMRGVNSHQAGLRTRSSLLASEPSQAGFLHSKTGAGESIFDLPVIGPDEKGLTEHLFGATGPLEVRNAVEGDIPDTDGRELGTMRMSGPRFLGVDGSGLDVPWRPSQPMPSWQPENHYEEVYAATPHPHTSMHTSSDMEERFTPPEFPSPPGSDDEHPTRASTWASNLRSTLFAAISGAPAAEPEDRFTRSVLPLHRNSTRRSVISTHSLTESRANTFPRRSFPMVIDEKDEQALESEMNSRSDAIGSSFLQTDMSRTSSVQSGFSVAGLPKAVTMGERYKTWSRSQRSMSVISRDSWTGIKATMAGGERAKGVKGVFA